MNRTSTSRDEPAKLAPLPPVEEELLLEEVVAEAPPVVDRASPVADLPRTAAEVYAAEAALRQAPERDAIARACLPLARRHVDAAALFVVNRGVVAGLRGEAEDGALSVEGVLIPADGESAFAAPLLDGEPVRFGASRHPLDVRVLRAMGREAAADRMLLPVAIRGRVVNLLYVDNGLDVIAVTAEAALRALARVVAEAYENLLIARKRARA